MGTTFARRQSLHRVPFSFSRLVQQCDAASGVAQWMKSSRCCYSPPPEEGWLRQLRKRPRSEPEADGVVKNVSDHPGRAFLTSDSASTPPLEEGNNSILKISSVAQERTY